jgi:hypothetical protein
MVDEKVLWRTAPRLCSGTAEEPILDRDFEPDVPDEDD